MTASGGGVVPRPTPEQWAAALAQLSHQQKPTVAMVRTVATGLGASERSVWRRLRDGPPAKRSVFELSATDIAAFADYRGNVAALHRARAAAIAGRTSIAGVPIPAELLSGWAEARPVTVRTLYRAFEAQMTPAAQAAARHGERARRAKQVYLRRPGTRRNQVWEGDHKNLPILVLPPRGRAIQPWITVFIDDATRVITGWALSPTPHTGTVLTALRMGMLPDPCGPATGVPAALRLDQGLEFAANAVAAAAQALGIEAPPLPGYHPHLKGKIERAFRTIDQMLLTALPGFTGGPRKIDGTLEGPLRDDRSTCTAYGDDSPRRDGPLPLPWEVFTDHIRQFIAWYNNEHIHSQLRGHSPAAAWRDDPTPLRTVDETDLRHLMLAGERRTIGANGIRFRNFVYTDPAGALRERRGKRVEIRYMPHDDTFIHVYLDGQHIATCHPDDTLTDEQVTQYYAAIREQGRNAAAAKRAASRRARKQLSVLSTAQQTVTDTRLVSAIEATTVTRAARTGDLRRIARTSLLDLRPVTPLVEPIDLEAEEAPWQNRPL
ncbi:Mu transposase C-terminal domain-containing protein [Micromonospora musae]|uniref:Mu transposase C-terminal domain-containing protein n=1 Tax=Micromonospora musae TaxID=1894970 RepID=UPI0033FA11AC